LRSPTKPGNAKYTNRYVAEIAETEHRDPLDVVLDLSLDENLETAFLGRFLNVGDDGVARLLKHEAGVVALSDAGAHLIYMCDAGFGLHFLARWVRERGDFDIVEGIRRLTSHPADLYGIPTAAASRSARRPTCCCSMPRRSASRRPSGSPTCRAAAAAPSAGRSACRACSATAS
jgi:N-acyl-D-aspartate/D-glutamate deacylase